jgi:cytochrome oxidase Cu insertion factor (SCO1/SenC/PrrC family)
MTPTPAPSRRPWRNPWIIATLAGLLALTALRACPTRSLSPLPVLDAVKPFRLTDQDGRPVTEADLTGRPTVVAFFFTSCRTVCPAIIRAMRDLSGHLEASPHAHRVRLLTVSVDPEFDTPEVLSAYARKENLDLARRRWSLLTGPRKDVEAFAVDNLKTAMGDRETQASGLIDIAHSMKLVLIDARGHVRHYFSSERADDLALAAAYALHYAEEASAP